MLKLATLAGIQPKVAYEARDRQVVHPEVLAPSDVLPLMTFDALRRVSWPGENIARAAKKRLRLWESLAIEQSRVDLDSVEPMTGLYVHPGGAVLAVRPSDHATAALQFVENQEPHLYLPLDKWASQTIYRLAHGNPVEPEPSEAIA
ncbi:hypothetical protein AB0G85_35945 [Streptomyces sioyaensis]|uniref:hypothetical protein n=1 Tax=Streptomyces sioyaensis TaxID=67364 RepID=UPI0033CEB9FA